MDEIGIEARVAVEQNVHILGATAITAHKLNQKLTDGTCTKRVHMRDAALKSGMCDIETAALRLRYTRC